LCVAPPAMASDAAMDVGTLVRAPPAFYEFCAHNPAACRPSGPAVASIVLTPQRLADLTAVTRRVNHSVRETTDFEQFGREDVWSYPVNGKGDCEDYVLEKRRELIATGWPSSVLLITIVRDKVGDGHAVLTVVTDHGDLVLDSRNDAITDWSQTPYTYYTRQASGDPRSFKTVDSINPSAVGPAAVAMRAAKLGAAAGAVASAAGKNAGSANGVGVIHANENSNAGGNRDNSHSNAGGNSASSASNSNAGGNSANAASNSNAGGNAGGNSGNANANAADNAN
jgi:predicted transglutaminase-like cysteine proteinase